MKTLLNEKLKYIILFLAIVLCIFGIHFGEAEVVLKKAVMICLECCGIG